MELWIIMLIIAGVALIVGLVFFILHKEYIGNPYTGFMGLGMATIVICASIFAVGEFNKGTIVYIDDGGEIAYAEAKVYNGEKYYPQKEKTYISVVDNDTIIIDGKVYLKENKFRSELLYDTTAKEGEPVAVEYNGQTYHLTSEAPAITYIMGE